MKRSQLKAVANRTNNPEDVVNYKRQRNFVVALNREAKNSYFHSTNRKSKHFWNAIKPNFSESSGAAGKGTQLLENNILYTDDKSVANIFNTYFSTITERLDISSWNDQTSLSHSYIDDSVSNRFANHPSIKLFKLS